MRIRVLSRGDSVVWALSFSLGCTPLENSTAKIDQVHEKSDKAFEQLANEELETRLQKSKVSSASHLETNMPTEVASSRLLEQLDKRMLVATGYGELSKGILTCYRVADIAARAELAKLIRVHIKERSVDRAGERTGGAFTQDVEVVREEMADEILKGVSIVDRAVNSREGTCSSKAVMPMELIVPTDKTHGSQEHVGPGIQSR